jgi:hypothetical protein
MEDGRNRAGVDLPVDERHIGREAAGYPRVAARASNTWCLMVLGLEDSSDARKTRLSRPTLLTSYQRTITGSPRAAERTDARTRLMGTDDRLGES